MLLILDLHYEDACTFVGWVKADTFKSHAPSACGRAKVMGTPAPYVAGEFWVREVPPIMSFLQDRPDILCDVTCIIVDCLCHLPTGKPSMGEKLYEALDRKYRVIGVAKTNFNDSQAYQITRSSSTRPLYITECGTRDWRDIGNTIRDMHGPYRIPTLLKLADSLARGHPCGMAASENC